MVFRDYAVWKWRQRAAKNKEFPRIIHQTWKTKELDENQRKWQASVQKIYPEYQYILWDDQDIENYVFQEFPEYYEMWKSLTPFIKKIDAVRYMWMYKIGGIYFDLDVIAYKSLEDILLKFPDSAFIPTKHSVPNWRHDTDAASPAILASYPGNPIWLKMLDRIAKNKDLDVLYATGPIGLANLLREIHIQNYDTNLILLSEPRLGLGLKFIAKYSKHINTSTWNK